MDRPFRAGHGEHGGYDRLAAVYDRRWATYVQATTRETLARVDLAGAREILDVGCGTGALLDAIARRPIAEGQPGRRLTGVDLSPRMLAVARGKLGRSAALAVADAARLPFRSERFDLAFSSSALHHLGDPLPALREIRRVLRPGGSVAITDWCGDRWIERLRTAILRRVDSAPLRVYRTRELVALLAEAGFGGIRVERWRIGLRWALMTAKATRPDG